MTLQDLTTFQNERSDKSRIFDALLISFCLIVLCWIPFVLEEYLGYHLKMYGMRPRTFEGLIGIFTMHFLHSDWKHIGQNTLGILVLNSFLFYFYRQIAFRIFIWIFLLSPIILWLVGRPSNHIGISVLLYGEFAFLLISGLIRRNPHLTRVALVVVLYYGSLVWYLFPIDKQISWEGHASGFLMGLILAVVFRKKGPQRKVYQFETEPELPDDENAYWKVKEQNPEPQQPQNTVTVRYHFKSSDEEKPVGN